MYKVEEKKDAKPEESPLTEDGTKKQSFSQFEIDAFNEYQKLSDAAQKIKGKPGVVTIRPPVIPAYEMNGTNFGNGVWVVKLPDGYSVTHEGSGMDFLSKSFKYKTNANEFAQLLSAKNNNIGMMPPMDALTEAAKAHTYLIFKRKGVDPNPGKGSDRQSSQPKSEKDRQADEAIAKEESFANRPLKDNEFIVDGDRVFIQSAYNDDNGELRANISVETENGRADYQIQFNKEAIRQVVPDQKGLGEPGRLDLLREISTKLWQNGKAYYDAIQKTIKSEKTGTESKVDEPQWKYDDYSPFVQKLAKTYTLKELEKQRDKFDGQRDRLAQSHLSSIEKTTSMQSNAQRRAQARNSMTANYQDYQDRVRAIEIYKYYPELTKEWSLKNDKIAALEGLKKTDTSDEKPVQGSADRTTSTETDDKPKSPEDTYQIPPMTARMSDKDILSMANDYETGNNGTVSPETAKRLRDYVKARQTGSGNQSNAKEKGGDRKPETPKAEETPPTPKERTAKLIEGTPRAEAAKASQELDDDYEFARSSSVPNAGEDLKGSARHKRNEWKGLKDAEESGMAETLVTRKNLLKNEPIALTENATEENYESALVAHFIMQKFPAEPYKPGDIKYYEEKPVSELREQYYQAFTGLKSLLEKRLKEGASSIQIRVDAEVFITKTIQDIRGQEVESKGRTRKDRFNPVANQIVSLYKAMSGMGTQSIFGRLREFNKLGSKKYDGNMTPAQGLDHAMSVLEGKSMPAAFEASEGSNRFNPYIAYVNKAERQGGRVINASTVEDGTNFMLNDIGVRGIQYGNSVTDGERIHHLQKTSESFADLADILGLPDKFISLGGQLGLAIGARGKGTASAHYERDTRVINLTRKSGVGTLAHEWGHAMDHYISGTRSSYLSGEALRGQATEMGKAMRGVMTALQDSGFESRLVDVLREYQRKGQISYEKGLNYWRSPHEKFARTFERYIQFKLDKQGRKNTYLSGLGDEGEGSLWPTQAEVEKMAPAFDALIDAIRKAAIAKEI